MEKPTKQFRKRNAILSCLQQTTAHPSAEMVLEMLQEEHPDISLATVYRNLSRFKDQGIITSLGTVGGVERFDANTEPHVHFICNQCYRVDDLPEMEIPADLSNAADRCSGGRAEICHLSFTGTCRDCLAEN